MRQSERTPGPRGAPRSSLAGLATALLVTGLLLAPRPAVAQIKASDAQEFVGTWNLSLQTQNGPFSMDITIKPGQSGMLSATVSSELGDDAVDTISRSGRTLTLDYSMDYQGQPVPVSIDLTPTDGGLAADLDFAGGQYTVSGKATKSGE